MQAAGHACTARSHFARGFLRAACAAAALLLLRDADGSGAVLLPCGAALQAAVTMAQPPLLLRMRRAARPPACCLRRGSYRLPEVRHAAEKRFAAPQDAELEGLLTEPHSG